MLHIDRTEDANFDRIVEETRQSCCSSDADKKLKFFLEEAKAGSFLRRHQWRLMRMGLVAALGGSVGLSEDQKEARKQSSKASRDRRMKDEGEASAAGISREELSNRRMKSAFEAVEQIIQDEASKKASQILGDWLCEDGGKLRGRTKDQLGDLAKNSGQRSAFYQELSFSTPAEGSIEQIPSAEFLKIYERHFQ